jgi:hypothetical protein
MSTAWRYELASASDAPPNLWTSRAFGCDFFVGDFFGIWGPKI